MNDLTKKIENLFLKYVWLIPACLPLAEAVGRTIFYFILTIYITLGLVVFIAKFKDVWISRIFFPLAALLLSFSVGMFYAEDFGRAFQVV